MRHSWKSGAPVLQRTHVASGVGFYCDGPAGTSPMVIPVVEQLGLIMAHSSKLQAFLPAVSQEIPPESGLVYSTDPAHPKFPPLWLLSYQLAGNGVKSTCKTTRTSRSCQSFSQKNSKPSGIQLLLFLCNIRKVIVYSMLKIPYILDTYMLL